MSRGSCRSSSSSKSTSSCSSNISSNAVRWRFKYALALLRRGHEVPISSSTMSRGSCCTSSSSSSKSNGGSSSSCSSNAVRWRFNYALILLRRGHEVPISISIMSHGS